MNNKFSIFNIAKKVGVLCLLFTVSGTEAMKAEHLAAIDQKIEELASTMHDAMIASGEYDGEWSLPQIRSSIKHHVGVRFINEVTPEEARPSLDAYLNIQGGHDHAAKHQRKEEKHDVAMLTTTAKSGGPHPQAPRQSTFTQATAVDFDAHSQLVDVPIDEVKALTLKISPTFARDRVDSVTLKSFRKVIGYDTFNSILRGDRDEQKDTTDHYNITVSMMVVRVPGAKADPTADRYNGGQSLAARLDKGFPYDDADSDLTETTAGFNKARAMRESKVGVLNGENITKEALINLIRDAPAPVTQSLAQTSSTKNDGDNLSILFDTNVTRGALKNLVTDKPAPITVKLAQKSDADNLGSIFDANITRGALKNLVTDKPAPITVKLAQKSDADNLSSLFDANITRGALKNLVTDKPAPITVKLA